MSAFCERCNRCHEYGLSNDEECCYYGEPNGCNHPNYGYNKEQKTYEELQKENTELRKFLKEALVSNIACYSCSFDCRNAIECPMKERWRTALEGGNHAND